MIALWVLAAILAPTLLGAAVVVAFRGRPAGRWGWIGVFGMGYVLGAVGLGVALRWAPSDLSDWPWLTVGILLLSALVHQVARAGVAVDRVGLTASGQRDWVVIALQCFLALLAVSLLVQSLTLPVLAWDAWTVWMNKPMAWSAAGQLLPTVDLGPWWASEAGTTRYVHAAGYPDTLPRFVLWVAGLHGRWTQPAAGLLWFLLWLAIGASALSNWIQHGLDPRQAWMATAVLLAMPLLNTHVALAGYADLWLASLVMVTSILGLSALRSRHRGEGALFLLCTLLLPTIKFEGAVWSLCFWLAAVVAAVPPRWRAKLGLAVLASGALALATGGLGIPMPGLGWAHLRWGAIEVPQLGEFSLHWRPVAKPVLQSIFVLPNWGLLGSLLPIWIWISRRRLKRSNWLTVAAVFYALGYGFLFVLFFFTDASRWAENLTSFNRIMLQIVPATVFCAGLLAVKAPVRGRYS